MEIKLIGQQEAVYASEILEKYYLEDFIPADKKPYLTKLKHSIGPYLAIESSNGNTAYLMDAASQIATMGLGFNPQSFLGVMSNYYTFNDLPNSESGELIIKAFKKFLKRKIGTQAEFIFCHSGAEANEIALGQCFERFEGKRKQVLAFEGSFHGRMQVALMSTWNPSKRIPFEMPNFEKTQYIPYPDIKDDDFDRDNTSEWKKLWENSTHKDFESLLDQYSLTHQTQSREIEVLQNVRLKLQGNSIFAIIIEPMQCEGGDNYATSAFYNALTILSKVYDVPLIFDEVQTGFHLGRDFFWFKSFNLTDSFGKELFPDFVTCAKKAQIGVVIDFIQTGHNRPNEFSITSLHRGLIHGQIIDQRSEQILKIESYTRNKLTSFVSKFSKYLACPRVCGISFAFDVIDKDFLNKFISKRFDIGLLYYPAGEKTLRFRTNLSFKESDIDFLFDRLDILADHLYNSKPLEPNQNIKIEHSLKDPILEWPQIFFKARQNKIDRDEVLAFCKKMTELTCIEIDSEKLGHITKDIVNLEEENYEEQRRTDISLFKQSVESAMGICLGLFDSNNQLIAISFSAPLEIFPFENGLRLDRNFHDPQSIYMIDTTVKKEFQGKNIGLHLKATLISLALLRGRNKIIGRTRQVLATSMFSVNMALGAYETQYIIEDYKDFLKYRDVIISEINLETHSPQILNSSLQNKVVSWDESKIEFIAPSLMNKICLSNFVSVDYLKNLKSISQNSPKELQHIYMASGQSECVDKIIKSIWYRSDKKRTGLMSIKGHHFGHGSFYSRAISGIRSVFDSHLIEASTKIKDIEEIIAKEKPLAFFISTFGNKISSHLPIELIDSIIEISQKHGVKVVVNDTSGHCFRGSKDHYFTVNEFKNTPDAFFCYLGGQAALCFVKDDIYVKDPLMMISTWDGDEASLTRAIFEKEWIEKNKEIFDKNTETFDEFMRKYLSQFKGQYLVKRGVVLSEKGFPTPLKHILPKATTTCFDTNYNARLAFEEKLRNLL